MLCILIKWRLKDETNFQLNFGFLLDTLIVWKPQMITSSCNVKFHTPKSESRFETHKNDFNLAKGQLLFAKYEIFTGLHLLNIVCWVFDQMNLIFNKWHLYDFIAMIRLWMHMIFEIGDLISEQERFTNREPWSDLQNHWHWQFLTIFEKPSNRRL